MISPRERQLAEGLENYLIGIQKAKQFSIGLLKWEERLLRMNEKEVRMTAKKIAAKVERYFKQREIVGIKASPEEIQQALKSELSSL